MFIFNYSGACDIALQRHPRFMLSSALNGNLFSHVLTSTCVVTLLGVMSYFIDGPDVSVGCLCFFVNFLLTSFACFKMWIMPLNFFLINYDKGWDIPNYSSRLGVFYQLSNMSSVWLSNFKLCLRLVSSEVEEVAVNFLLESTDFFLFLGDGTVEECGTGHRALLCSTGLAVPLDGRNMWFSCGECSLVDGYPLLVQPGFQISVALEEN